MQLALIPPYENANIIAHTNYQLLLPQCLSNRRYRFAYRRARRRGSYMILDNGAAEGVEVEPDLLLHHAQDMMVNEIVVPDTIGDVDATLQQAARFRKGVGTECKFNYMGVVQGTTWQECLECIAGFASFSYITTLGIPRHLLDISEDFRANLVDFIRGRYEGRWQIHLLGMNRKYTNELISFGRTYRTYDVRGIDTSAPFIYAMSHIPLTRHGEVLQREENYFHRSIDATDLVYINLTIMKDWVYSDVRH